MSYWVGTVMQVNLNNPKVVHISLRHSADDLRIFHKECTTLSKNNFNVYYMVPTNKIYQNNKVKIIPIKDYGSEIKNVTKNYLTALKKSFNANSNIYHLHDPDLIPIGILLKLIRKKVVYDAHEDHQKNVLKRGKNKIFIASIFYIFEKIATFLFDHIIVATPEIGKKYPEKKTSLIMNVPILSLIDTVPSKKISKEKFAVIYPGWITEDKGIIEALIALDNFKGKVELWLFGQISKKINQDLIKIQGNPNVKYFGIVEPEELYAYMKNADVGIITLHPKEAYITSLPVKTFEYMACSLPIIMSDFPYWKEIFDSCALFVDPTNPLDISEKLNALISNKSLRKSLGKNGRRLVETKYNWEVESEKLIEVYKSLVETKIFS